MQRRLIAVVAGLLVLAGAVATPAGAQDGDPPRYAKPKVMTLNLYVGADLASFDALAILNTIQATNFPERAATMAEEIGDRNPDLIGLQEVSDLSVTVALPGEDGALVCDPKNLGPTVPVPGTPANYLDILLEELRAEGETYHEASAVVNAQVSLPFQIETPDGLLLDVCGNLTDRDVILSRAKTTTTTNPRHGNYAVNFVVPFPSPEDPTEFTRGWTAVDAVVNGSPFTFVNTHLEVEPDVETGAGFCIVAGNPIPCQIPQAAELVELLSGNTYPTILVGDFNAEPGTVAYNTIAGAGFVDAWDIRLLNTPQQENTCCQAEDLLNPFSELSQRIDIVFIRVDSDPVSLSTVVFDRYWEKTPSGLWPTDHGSVVSRLIYENP